MFKPGQKVIHQRKGWNGVVVARAPKFGKNWSAVMWTLPNGRREQRDEHYTALEPREEYEARWHCHFMQK